jgi:hypothetical protein
LDLAVRLMAAVGGIPVSCSTCSAVIIRAGG